MLRLFLLFWLLPLFASAATHQQGDLIAHGLMSPYATGQDMNTSGLRWDIFVGTLNTPLGAGYCSIDGSGNLARIAYGASTTYARGDGSIQTLNTAAVPESGNLYYTDARARAALSGTAPISYNSSTGAFSCITSDGSTTGCLTGADWTTFNSKQAGDSDLTSIAALSGIGFAARTASDTWALRTFTAPAAGFTITNPAGVAGDPTFVLANDLAALEAMSGTGLVARTAAETYAQRTITAPAEGISVSNGDGVSGNPTLALTNDLSALEALGSTGIAVRTGSDAWAQRAITVTAPIAISNGDGVSGNPALSCNVASGSQPGCLASADFTTFNGKESVLTFNTGLTRSTNTVTCDTASGSVKGCLAAADYTTFNGKIGGVTTFGSTPNANGLSVSGTNILMQPADATNPGGVSTAAQDIAGEKRLVNALGFKQVSTPATPSATYNKLYFKSDDKLYKLDSTGTETEVASGGGGGGTVDISNELTNVGCAVSLSGNAMTVALKQKDGSTDPASGSGAVKIAFRNTTGTTGGYTQRSVTGALSVTASSGSTLGSYSGFENNAYLYAIDNAGTVELGISGSPSYDNGELYTTTAEGGAGAADSKGVIYSTTARTSKPVRLLCRIRSTQATAGTWVTSPSSVAVAPFLDNRPRAYSRVHTQGGNGSGSFTKIIYYNTTVEYFGSDLLTYTHSTSDGDSWTAQVEGLVCAYASINPNATINFGWSLTSSQGTTNFQSTTTANRATFANNYVNGASEGSTWCGWMRPQDVLRVHGEGSGISSGDRATATVIMVNN